MRYIGVDLHKRTLSACVVSRETGRREVMLRRTIACRDVEQVAALLREQAPCQVVVEATSSYEWFAAMAEPLVDRFVLAHPAKLRVIAESTRKTDKLDAQVLGEFLAMDMIPEAHRPSPRIREHRVLVRQRCYIQRRSTSVKNKLRWVLAGYNADVKRLFSQAGRAYLSQVNLSPSDRFVVGQLVSELDQWSARRAEVDRQLRQFAKSASVAEREARAVLESIPCVGPVTIDVVLSELGDIRRFRSCKQVVAYAGLAPGIRSSGGRTKQQGISREGSRRLRWAMVELAWRMVTKTRRWGLIYENLKRRMGSKKAVVAVARRLLVVIATLLRSGQKYCQAADVPAPTSS